MTGVSGTARASSILLKKRLVCSSVLVVAEDPWLPRSTCPVRSRGDDALGDLAFGHAHSSPKLGHEDQGWKRFLKARKARRRSEHDFRQASRSRREPVRALASATHTLYNLAVSELPATGDRPRRTCVVSAIGSGESLVLLSQSESPGRSFMLRDSAHG